MMSEVHLNICAMFVFKLFVYMLQNLFAMVENCMDFWLLHFLNYV